MQYLKWCEQIAWEHSRHLGVTLALFKQLDCALVVHQHELHYNHACYEGQHLQLNTWIEECTAVKMWRYYTFYCLEQQRIVFTAKTKWVCIALSTGQIKRMPVEFLTAYGK